jgi:hypothetical protein
MARGGRRRGRGGPDLDAFYDLTYATCSVMPQGIMGTQFSYVGSEWGFMARMNSLSHAEFQQIQ